MRPHPAAHPQKHITRKCPPPSPPRGGVTLANTRHQVRIIYAASPGLLIFFCMTTHVFSSVKQCAFWKLRPTCRSSVIVKTYLLVNNADLQRNRRVFVDKNPSGEGSLGVSNLMVRKKWRVFDSGPFCYFSVRKNLFTPRNV